MTRYSIEPRDQIFVKVYGFLYFAENMNKNFGKNISKNLSGKYSPVMLAARQNLLDHPKKSATDARKTASNNAIQKIAEATSDFIGNKIYNRTTKISRTSPQNSSNAVTNKTNNIRHDKEIPKERNIYPEKNY